MVVSDTCSTSANTWRVWTNGTVTATTCTGDVWGAWVSTTASTSTAGTTIWATWNEGVTITRQQRELTEAQLRHERERQEALRIQREEEQEKRKLAAQRAMMLLLANLSAKQRAEFEEKKHFHVTAKSGRRYQVREGVSHNLKLVDTDGKVLKSLCVHPQGVPVGDVMLAQKLAIETDEEAMLKVANVQNVAA